MKTRSHGLIGYLFTCVLLLSLGTLACSSIPSSEPRTTWEGGRAQVSLEYSGKARSVAVVGDFNDWNPNRNPLVQMGEGHWSCNLDLPPGEHLYLLAIEKGNSWSWQLDPANPLRQEVATGRELSLLRIRSTPPAR